jgi:F-type H+-transporting ATPase subunit gamma
MAKGLEIKRRIRSIKSMLQVTKAMELIASIKMRKTQEAALRSKTYVFESWRTIIRLARLEENKNNPLLATAKDGKVIALVIASDRGLAGSYNADILKKALLLVKEYGLENIDFMTMGKKAQDFIRKIGGNIVADFPLGQNVRFSFISPVALIGWNGFVEGKYSRFISIHTHFESAAKHNATQLQILPIDLSIIEEDKESLAHEFIFEPSKPEVLETIIRHTVRALTYQVILESEAAEHASRMIAMKNASDSAEDLKEDFEFTYNQIRQQAITQELAEISAGSNALE